MANRKIAFPGTTEGLDGEISGHFGHTPLFTTISYNEETGDIDSVEIIENPPHEGGGGGCMTPVMLLKNNDVTDVILRGIGYRPLMGFKQVEIQAYHGIEGTIKENFELFKKNQLEPLYESSCNHK